MHVLLQYNHARMYICMLLLSFLLFKVINQYLCHMVKLGDSYLALLTNFMLLSGRCKPPTSRKYVFENATYWTIPESGLKSTDVDCKMWSNDQQCSCYECKSCKAGVPETIKNKWKPFAVFNIALLVFLSIIYRVWCCALRNNKNHKKYADINDRSFFT